MTPATEPVCPKCGARQPGSHFECWLCGTELGSDAIQVAVVKQHARFSLATLLLLITVVAVSLGMWSAGFPFLGGLLALIGLRTFLVIGVRRLRGLPTSGERNLWYFIESITTTVILAIVAGVAGFIAMFALCVTNLAGTTHSSSISAKNQTLSTSLNVLAGGLVVLIVGVIVYRFVKDVRKKP